MGAKLGCCDSVAIPPATIAAFLRLRPEWRESCSAPGSVASVPLTLPVVDGDDSTYIADVAIAGTIAYALGNRGDLWVIDFSTPGSPVVTDAIRATFSFGGLPTRYLMAAGDVLFLAAGAFGVIAIDVSDPSSIGAAIGSVPISTEPVAVSGRYAVVGHRDALEITVIDLGE
jgi:hypothetical protein